MINEIVKTYRLSCDPNFDLASNLNLDNTSDEEELYGNFDYESKDENSEAMVKEKKMGSEKNFRTGFFRIRRKLIIKKSKS